MVASRGNLDACAVPAAIDLLADGAHVERSPMYRVDHLEVPLLVIRGASSDTCLPGAANKIQRVLPGATVIELPDTTHFLPMEQPAAIAAAIIVWHQNLSENV